MEAASALCTKPPLEPSHSLILALFSPFFHHRIVSVSVDCKAVLGTRLNYSLVLVFAILMILRLQDLHKNLHPLLAHALIIISISNT
jgi:hypothetical protein